MGISELPCIDCHTCSPDVVLLRVREAAASTVLWLGLAPSLAGVMCCLYSNRLFDEGKLSTDLICLFAIVVVHDGLDLCFK